jgi:hypothetical protein
MNKENDELLCERYPKIFADRRADMRTTCMCWGFECGNGWMWLIDQLCKALQDRIDNTSPHPPQVIAAQVKEKFGSLRFYISGGDEGAQGMIDLAEHMSINICEACGSIKNVGRTSGWISVRCEDCAKAEGIMDRWKSNEEWAKYAAARELQEKAAAKKAASAIDTTK